MDKNQLSNLEAGALASLPAWLGASPPRAATRARILGLLLVLVLGARSMAHGQQPVVGLTVGVNKDIQNNTGQIADGVKILLAGSYTNVNHYDGYAANHFASFNASPSGGNTLLTWSNPNNAVQPGQITHVGFNVPGSTATILGIEWTRNGHRTGCVHQVSTNTHAWGSAGSQVIYENNTLDCCMIPRYVGKLTVEWHQREVPLADLNPRTRRDPIRTDVIQQRPARLTPGAKAVVKVPAGPKNAKFAVLVLTVGPSDQLSGPDVTHDFLEFPVEERPRKD
jgi:hypothetical protein